MKQSVRQGPVKPARVVKNSKGDLGYNNRVLIATPTRGTVRMEWVSARYSQTIPTNWSQVTMNYFMNPFIPLGYSTMDAENIIAKEIVEKDFEWLIMIEDDNIIPWNTFLKFNDYMREGKYPVVSGLYYTKSVPPEPILYRGKGNSYYDKWKKGDKVFVDGLPFGCVLIHCSLIKYLWKHSPEYMAGDVKTRRVFNNLPQTYVDPEKGIFNSSQGTTDLAFCHQIIDEGILAKTGWKHLANKKYPFIVDTSIMVGHIDPQGVIYPRLDK